MALTRLYYIVGGGNFIFFIHHLFNHRILPLPKKVPPYPFYPKNIFPLPLDILFIPMLCYIHSEKKKKRIEWGIGY